ncbi:MAG: cyclic nucleotide-binding domain-containing protein, partial [Oxalobacteraceae bacterium]
MARSATSLSDGHRPCSARIIVIIQSSKTGRASSALSRKLAKVLHLSEEDQDALDGLGWDTRKVQARRDLIADGERPKGVNLVMSGWACRYKMLRSGARQITAILMPGDFCDLHVTMLAGMDHGIAALSPVTVARVSRSDLERLRAERPAISMGLDWMTMVDLG